MPSDTTSTGRLSPARYFLPQLRDIVFLLVFAAALAAGWRSLNTDGDLPRHLLMGRVIVETHSVPHQELFSYVYAGRPYVAHEWLADVAYYLAYWAMGMKGVVLLTAILIAATFALLFWGLSRQFDERLLLLVLVLWGAIITFQHWIARPHLFTMLFLAIWLILVDRLARGDTRSVWLLPLLMLIWANTHAEFVAGFLVLLAFLAGSALEQLRHGPRADSRILKSLGLAMALSLLASLITPFGIQTWQTLLRYIGNPFLMSTIRETQPPNMLAPAFLGEFAMMLFSVLLIAVRPRAISISHALLLAGFTILAVAAGRNIHLYGVVAPYVLARPLIAIADIAPWRRLAAAVVSVEKQLRGVAWPIMTVMVSVALLLSGILGRDYRLDPRLFPVNAVDWLQENPQSGRVFNAFVWGGYLVWRLWPAEMDFIDSQSDTTGQATSLFEGVEKLKPGWQQVFDTYQVQWVLFQRDAPLVQALLQAGWVPLYQDSTAIILRRQ